MSLPPGAWVREIQSCAGCSRKMRQSLAISAQLISRNKSQRKLIDLACRPCRQILRVSVVRDDLRTDTFAWQRNFSPSSAATDYHLQNNVASFVFNKYTKTETTWIQFLIRIFISNKEPRRRFSTAAALMKRSDAKPCSNKHWCPLEPIQRRPKGAFLTAML